MQAYFNGEEVMIECANGGTYAAITALIVVGVVLLGLLFYCYKSKL
jgi:hypothetical protein